MISLPHLLATLNPLDWLLLLILVYSAGRALLRGFIRECFALAGLVAAFLLACWYYPAGAVLLERAGIGQVARSPAVVEFVAFLLILCLTMAAAALLGTFADRTASAIGLGLLNRVAGAAFGLARGVVLGSALLVALTAFLPATAWVRHSRLSPYLLRATHAVSFVMPQELAARLAEARGRLKHTAPGWIKSPHP